MSDGELEPIEAEVIDEQVWDQRRLAGERWRGYGTDLVVVAQGAHRAATHPGVKWVARNLLYVPAGAWVVFRRWRETHTNARYERMMRAAEQGADWQRVLELEARSELARDRRHKRVMDWLRAPAELVKALAVVVFLVVGALLVLGVAGWWISDGAMSVVGPIHAVMVAIAFVVWVVAVGGPMILAGVVALVVGVLWWVGREGTQVPPWLAPTSETRDDAITPGGVAAALAHLNIPALNTAIKKGWAVEFLVPPTLVNGRGYQVVLSTPMGVTAGMIADKRDILARNLIRAPLEVWPSASDHAGYVDLWVAHPGSTNRVAAPYPLLHDGVGDVFAGVPVGETQRGDVLMLPLMEASMCIGGIPGQGKSNAARVVMAGACLDPLAVCRAYVFAGNGDFDAYAPRLHRYRRGTDESVVQDALAELRELYAEVERREHRLADLGAKKLSRGLATKHADLRPIVEVFSECHELFGHPDLGKEAGDLATLIVKRMRKCGMFLMFDTQSSRADAIPTKLVELMRYNACFHVKTWRSNDGFLGDGSFQIGIRATELRANRDRGTSLVTGATEERFEILRWFYIAADDDTGFDAATDIIARATQALPSPAPSGPRPAAAERDLLDDVFELMGDEDRVRASEMAVMLRRAAPEHLPYSNLDGVRLAAMLAEHGVLVKVHKGFPKIEAAQVLAARDRRGG